MSAHASVWEPADLAALEKCEQLVLDCSGSVRDFLANESLKRCLLGEDMDAIKAGARHHLQMELLLERLKWRSGGMAALLFTLKREDYALVARQIEDEREKLLLCAFHRGTKGRSWKNSLEGRWLSPLHRYSDWGGVHVTEGESGQKYVTGIELPGNNVGGQLPPSIGELHRLQTLDLSSNELEDELPAEIGGCHSLKHLDLARNSLVGAIPLSIGRCTKLRQVLLQDNALGGELPTAELAGLTELDQLDLQRNEGLMLTEEGRSEIQLGAPNAKVLY